MAGVDPVPSKDLVLRLHEQSTYLFPKAADTLMEEAAAEIKRLREDCRRWENAHKILLAENERLKRELEASQERERQLVQSVELRDRELDEAKAAHEPAADVLSKIDELLQTMIVSAEVFTDHDGTVTGYKIKTGALHKIVGLRTHLFFPQNMKEAERPAQPPRDGQ